MKNMPWFMRRFMVLFLGVSVMTLPTVAADGDFGGEDDEWSSSSDKSRKKVKKKAKRAKRQRKSGKTILRLLTVNCGGK